SRPPPPLAGIATKRSRHRGTRVGRTGSDKDWTEPTRLRYGGLQGGTINGDGITRRKGCAWGRGNQAERGEVASRQSVCSSVRGDCNLSGHHQEDQEGLQ